MSCLLADSEKDTQTDADAIAELIERSELQVLAPSDATVIKDAIERLYFKQEICIDNAVYPNERIRDKLKRLDPFIIQDAVNKLTRNSGKIRNSSAYVTTVLFNTIMESGSDLLVDPYLNSWRNPTVFNSLLAGGD
jgi:hypothetical protein